MSHACGPLRPRQLHLNINLLRSGFVPSAGRVAEADPHAFVDVAHCVRVAQLAEAARFDAVFLADNASIADQIRFRPITALEPTVLLASIAAATSHIGVIGTASTSYNEPYNIARRFTTLDHVSAGRAGWNVVTTADLASARNFGREAVPDHAERYARAAEFTELVKALWDSREDDVFIGDKTASRASSAFPLTRSSSTNDCRTRSRCRAAVKADSTLNRARKQAQKTRSGFGSPARQLP